MFKADAPSSLRNSTPCRPKGLPLYLFEITNFGYRTLKFFERHLWRNYLYFEGEARAKKRDFLVIHFRKVPKTSFLACFLAKTVFLGVWESSKNQFGRQFFEIRPSPSRENPCSVPSRHGINAVIKSKSVHFFQRIFY